MLELPTRQGKLKWGLVGALITGVAEDEPKNYREGRRARSRFLGSFSDISAGPFPPSRLRLTQRKASEPSSEPSSQYVEGQEYGNTCILRLPRGYRSKGVVRR
jgi:hypothetical protein